MTCRTQVAGFAVLLLVALWACKKKSADEHDPEQQPAVATADSQPGSKPEVPSAAASFAVGDPVDVEWNGSWWKATVLEVQEGPKYKVHYVGWSSSWDEVVGPARIRRRTAESRTK